MRIPGPTFALPISVVGTVAVSLIDWASGPQLALSIAYVLPLGVAAWCGGRRHGLIVAALAAVGWFLVDCTDHQYSHPAYYVWNTMVRAGFFVLTAVLLARVKELTDLQHELARSDPLTGTANARAFYEAVETERLRSHRTGSSFGILYVDLDNFKLVNDEYGHSAGDALLRNVAQEVRGRLRQTDVVARLGGDEFAILLPETAAAGVENLGQVLLELIRIACEKAHTDATASVGAVTWLTSPKTAEQAIQSADTLMYEAKRAGKNCFVHRRSHDIGFDQGEQHESGSARPPSCRE